MVDLSKVISKIKKDFGGKDSTVGLGSSEPDTFDYISTGNLALDLCSEGGFPFGYCIELLGLSQSGKSLLVYNAIAVAQRQYDAIGILVDRENAYTKQRGEQLGIDNEKLLIVKPMDIPKIPDAFQFILDSVSSIREQDKDQYIIIGIDSISSFGKDVLLEKADPGRKAKAVHEGLRETLTKIDRKVILLVCNQVTYKVGVMYGNPKTTTAGESMKYYSNVRFSLDEKALITDPSKNDEVIGTWIEIEIIKTRIGPCYRTCYIPHFYKEGIPYYGGYARLLADRNYISPKNKKEFNSFRQRTLTYNDEQVNEFNIEPFLEKHPELLFDKYPEFYKETKDDNRGTEESIDSGTITEDNIDSEIDSYSEV